VIFGAAFGEEAGGGSSAGDSLLHGGVTAAGGGVRGGGRRLGEERRVDGIAAVSGGGRLPRGRLSREARTEELTGLGLGRALVSAGRRCAAGSGEVGAGARQVGGELSLALLGSGARGGHRRERAGRLALFGGPQR
jgi:hypothetical protein